MCRAPGDFDAKSGAVPRRGRAGPTLGRAFLPHGASRSCACAPRAGAASAEAAARQCCLAAGAGTASELQPNAAQRAGSGPCQSGSQLHGLPLHSGRELPHPPVQHRHGQVCLAVPIRRRLPAQYAMHHAGLHSDGRSTTGSEIGLTPPSQHAPQCRSPEPQAALAASTAFHGFAVSVQSPANRPNRSHSP